MLLFNSSEIQVESLSSNYHLPCKSARYHQVVKKSIEFCLKSQQTYVLKIPCFESQCQLPYLHYEDITTENSWQQYFLTTSTFYK